MSKSPIWLDDMDSEIALGFIAEILTEDLSDIDRRVLSNIYSQLSNNLGIEKNEGNHYCVEIDTTAKHTIYIYAPDKETAQLNACSAVLNSFKGEHAVYGKIWSHKTESNFNPKSIVSSVREIQG